MIDLDNSIVFIKTHRAVYLVRPVNDSLRESMNLLFGYCYHCAAIRTWEFGRIKKDGPKVWHKVNKYSRFVSIDPIQICDKNDIEVMRAATDDEVKLFNRCAHKAKTLTKAQMQWLRDNAMDDQTIGVDH